MRDTLLSSKMPVDNNLLKADVTTLQNTMARIVEQGKATKVKIENLQNDLKNVGDTNYSEEEYKNLNAESRNLISKMAEARTNIANLNKTNTNLANAEYCPTCHRKFDNVDNSGSIEQYHSAEEGEHHRKSKK